MVSRSNRSQFVDSFVRHALHGSVSGDIEQYVRGLKTCFHAAALDMCSASEVRTATELRYLLLTNELTGCNCIRSSTFCAGRRRSATCRSCASARPTRAPSQTSRPSCSGSG